MLSRRLVGLGRRGRCLSAVPAFASPLSQTQALAHPVFVLSYPGSRVLSLASPGTGNELGPAVTGALEHHLRSYESNETVSAVFFASRSPDVFSTSAQSSSRPNLASLGSFVTALSSFKKPTLAVYSGSVNGTGFAAFSTCKYLLGGPSLSLVSDELSQGKLPSAGFAFQFTKCGRHGVSLARYLAVSQREVRADELYNLGLLTHLVEDEAYVSLADALAHTIPPTNANDGAIVVESAIEDLLDTMHVEETSLGDPLAHEAWDKLVLVPPNREDTKPRPDDASEVAADLYDIRDDVLKCFGGTPEMAIKKLSEIDAAWARHAIEQLGKVDRNLLNSWWRITESVSFPGVKLADILRQESVEAR